MRRARRFAEAVCARLPRAQRDDVLLCVSELVTNVIVHTSAPGELRVGVTAGRVRLEVDDASGTPPELSAGPGAGRAVGGRGLRIIDQLAVSWGHVRHPGGKTVWVELPEVPRRPG